jgi:hypothetical protein
MITKDEEYRLSEICYRSKKGCVLTDEERKFISAMFSKDMENYTRIQQAAANEAIADFKKSFK